MQKGVLDPLFVLEPGGYCWAFPFLGKGLELPRAVVYNIKELPQEQFEYNEDCMMSVEV